jgi:hypothetical protein
MTSDSRTLSAERATEGVRAESEGAKKGGWAGRYLPPAGLERKLYVGLWVVLLAVKALTIYHFRADGDETQHAHVVWEWATGHLQYRDVFDNHMPLFQMLCGPLMAALGPRADIMVMLRWAMVPLYGVCVWCVFRLTEVLFSRRLAPWMALAAGALPKFFYTSTEFRPDDLWAVFWLLGLVVAVSGPFTMKRAFAFGLMLGLTFAVSLKTVVLVAGLLTATVLAMGLGWVRRQGPGVVGSVGRLAAIVAGAVIPVGTTVLYFYRQGAFWIMYYCVVSHNVVPRMKRWGHLSAHVWIFPIAVAASILVVWLISRQTRDTGLAMRRTIVLLTPWFFLCLLLSYWPDITREDDVPYVPLTPLLAVPLVMWISSAVKLPKIEARFFTWVMPAVCFAELLWVWNIVPLRSDRLKVTTRSIADVLLLTGPNDYVMDMKGDYIFRKRPYYWAFETITKTRMRMGLIKDDLIERMEKHETKMAFLFSAHVLPAATRFIVTNYISFDKAALDLAVAGKELGNAGADGTYSFDVAIPATYAVVSETGTTAGILDGAPYVGAVRLGAGHHTFHRTNGSGRVAIFLDSAAAEGFHPLFDVSEKIIQKEQTSKDG